MAKIYLKESLQKVIGFEIGAYTSDGELIEGVLSEIKDDFLIIKDDKGRTFFLSIDKIQAFAKNTKQFESENHRAERYHENSLIEVIDNYKYSWVTIHCPQDLTFKGVLTEIAKDYIVLTIDEEKMYIQKDNITTFYPENPKPSKKQLKKDGKKNKMHSKEKPAESNNSSDKSDEKKAEKNIDNLNTFIDKQINEHLHSSFKTFTPAKQMRNEAFLSETTHSAKRAVFKGYYGISKKNASGSGLKPKAFYGISYRTKQKTTV